MGHHILGKGEQGTGGQLPVTPDFKIEIVFIGADLAEVDIGTDVGGEEVTEDLIPGITTVVNTGLCETGVEIDEIRCDRFLDLDDNVDCASLTCQVGGQLNRDRAGITQMLIDPTGPGGVIRGVVDTVDETAWYVITAVEVNDAGIILGGVGQVEGVVGTGKIPVITDSENIVRMCCYNVVQRTAGCRTVRSICVAEILEQHSAGGSSNHGYQQQRT